MNKLTYREDIIYFTIIFFIAFSFGDFFFWMYYGFYLEDGPELRLYLSSAIYTLPIIYFIRREKIYATVFATFILSIIWMFYLMLKNDMMIWHRWKGYWLDIWECIFFLISLGIYFGFKIMIKEYIKYRKLPDDERRIQRSFKCIANRVFYFFLSILIPILILLVLDLLKIGAIIYDELAIL